MNRRTSLAIFAATLAASSVAAQAQNLHESFDAIATLAASGWVQTNLSDTPAGNWFQGNTGVFGPEATTGYIGANYQNSGSTATNATLSNWLITPSFTLHNGDTVSFWSRTVDTPAFPDRLEVRLSTNGTSSDVGATPTSVGDFTTVLLTINPNLTTADYPNVWTQYTLTLSGLTGTPTGRIAFRYFVINGGLNGSNSDYIGVDEFDYSVAGTPTGACCLPNGTCTNSQTASQCTSAQGVYQNNGSMCGQTPCPSIGICCSSGACTVSLTGGCAAGSQYILHGVCTPNGCVYCVAGSGNCLSTDTPPDERISEVHFNTIHNVSGTGDGPAGCYSDFTSISTNVTPGQTYAISIVNAGPYTVDGLDMAGVWIDWNQDFTFGDVASGEQTLVTSTDLGATFTGMVTVPMGATPGPTRMRVRVNYDETPVPCGTSVFGEVEDYTVNVVSTAQPGACCSGATCVMVADAAACTARNPSSTPPGANTRFTGAGQACNAAGNNTTPCCKADYNQNGSVSIQDLFDFLAGWFGKTAQADINLATGAPPCTDVPSCTGPTGVTVQDLFDYLGVWFATPHAPATCP